MPTHQLILTNWKREQKQLARNLAVLEKRIDQNAVHNIRVAIKKLRALLELYHLIQKETGHTIQFPKTEELFDILGRQRDIEICLEILPGLEKETGYRYSEFSGYIKSQLKKAKTWTSRAIRSYDKKELPRMVLRLKEDNNLNNETILLQSIREVTINFISDIKNYFKKPHKLRQNLKTIYYWIHTLPEENYREEYRSKDLHQILDDFGNWQDMVTLESRVRHYRKDYLPAPFEESAMLKSLEKVLYDKKEFLRKSTLRRTRNWQKKILETGKN